MNRIVINSLLYFIIISTLIILIFPIVWMLLTAFKSTDEIFKIPPTFLPKNFSFDAFSYALNSDMPIFFINSIIIAFFTSLITIFVGGLASYGISRAKHWTTNTILMFFLASMAFPIPLLMITIYKILNLINGLDTYWAVIVGHMLITLPIVIWLMKGFIDDLPIEVEESAYIDGASIIQIIYKIVFPMTKPGVIASAIYVFVTSWNEFIFGLSFTTSTDMRPLPAGINLVFLQEFQYQWPEMMAVATIATLPILLMFLFLQRYFVQGVTAGAVKN